MAPSQSQRPSRLDKFLTVDELAATCGTTTRRIRSLQTLGLMPRPSLQGRTGLYGTEHQRRLVAILRLQEQGFSLESLGVLFGALTDGRSLADVLGVSQTEATSEHGSDEAELYGFADLQRSPLPIRSGRSGPLLSIVPTTVWDESEAS